MVKGLDRKSYKRFDNEGNFCKSVNTLIIWSTLYARCMDREKKAKIFFSSLIFSKK